MMRSFYGHGVASAEPRGSRQRAAEKCSTAERGTRGLTCSQVGNLCPFGRAPGDTRGLVVLHRHIWLKLKAVMMAVTLD